MGSFRSTAPFLSVLSLASLVFAGACKVEHEQPVPDASASQDDAGGQDAPEPDDVTLGDTSISNCNFDTQENDDPVALCIQKSALAALHMNAFSATAGVATSWSSATGLPDTMNGVELHSWTDDVAYGASCALYQADAIPYGDTSFTGTASADLIALVPLLTKELTPLPAVYEGDDYRRLRTIAGGLNAVNDTMDATTMSTFADAYGRQIYAKYFAKVTVAPASDAGVSDGGISDASPSDGSVNDGGVKDGGRVDASLGDASVNLFSPDGIIGTPAAGGGYAYVVPEVATAALALIDMTNRHPSDPDAAAWQQAAILSLEHLYERARDPMTGLYYYALVTSNDAGHDRIDTSVTGAGILYSDTTATIALSLARAQALVNTDQAAHDIPDASYDAGMLSLPLLAAYPFSAHVDDALGALNNSVQSLYDGPSGDAAATSTGFIEGYDPGGSPALLTNKTTRANAYALAALHLQETTVGTSWDTEIVPLTQTLTATSPLNSSLYTLIAGQTAYFRAGSRTFATANESFGTSYQTAAVAAFIEGMSELLPSQ